MVVASADFTLDGTAQLRHGWPGFWRDTAYYCAGPASTYINSLHRLYLLPGWYWSHPRFPACQTCPAALQLCAGDYWYIMALFTAIRASGSFSNFAHTWRLVGGRFTG